MSELISRQKLKPCPFCGSQIRIFVCDDEGNLHFDDYEKDPWSGLGYKLYHDIEDTPTNPCPIARHEGEGEMGVWIYDTREDAIEAWNKRVDQPPADQWIPCSSGRVPKEKENVHVTILNEDSGERRIADTKFDGRDYAIRLDYSERIVAWMPANLPEPYKGVE